jgi:signal transduction histidine kinase
MGSDSTQLLQAVHLAARRLSSSDHMDRLLVDVLGICLEAVGAESGTIYLHEKATRRLLFRHILPEEVARTIQLQDIPDDFGVAGRVFHSRRTEISDFDPQDPEREKIDARVGTRPRTMITVALTMEDMEPIGVVQLVNKRRGVFGADDVMVLDTVSAIATMAYLNSLLLEQQARSSQLLGMGKVAHDIKNMAFALEANISLSDMLLDEARAYLAKSLPDDGQLAGYVDSIEQTFRELADSIDRVKRYSVLMSDLSAGRALNPTWTLAPAAPTIEKAASFLESEGRSHGVGIRYDIQSDAPPLRHDEMYLFRIVQNLVSNAVKAVAEKAPAGGPRRSSSERGPHGFVTVRYRGGSEGHVLEVEDEGPGMSEETVGKILSGNARSLWDKSSGSGWGTKIVLELAGAIGARVSISSELGKGSVFRVAFPGEA